MNAWPHFSQVSQGKQPEVYQYTLNVAAEVATAKPKRGFGDEFKDAYSGFWFGVFVVAMLPFVLVGAAVSAATD